MEHGQLGTAIQQRVIFIWEGAFAAPPSSHLTESLLRKTHRWDSAVGLWEIHPVMVGQVWYLRNHTPYLVDLAVTTRESGFTRSVAKLVERENIPIRYVFRIEPEKLGQRLPYMPDVVRVFWGLESQRWVFGPKGYGVPPDGKGFQALL
jgi:hypothetical protein